MAITMHPAHVRAWGVKARTSGNDVKTAKPKIADAEESVNGAHAAGLRCKAASQRWTDAIESGIGTVGRYVHGTGDRLVDTAAVVRSSDEESANLFRHYGGPTP